MVRTRYDIHYVFSELIPILTCIMIFLALFISCKGIPNSDWYVSESKAKNVVPQSLEGSQATLVSSVQSPESINANSDQNHSFELHNLLTSDEILKTEFDISSNPIISIDPVFPNRKSLVSPSDLRAEKLILHSKYSLDWFFGSTSPMNVKTRNPNITPNVEKTSSLRNEIDNHTSQNTILSASYVPKTIYTPPRAENGDSYNRDNDGDGRVEPVYVKGYYRKDGTYVRSHYRAAPRR